MEPLSLQSTAASAQVRPVGLQPDLAALLQDGRVVAGQVMETFGGGSILLGVGRHRVPAESQVELGVGQRFLFQVEERTGELLLHVLGAGPGEPDLVRALRAAVGQDRPVAELLGRLAAQLRAELAGGVPRAADAEGLLADLNAHVFRPGSDGPELATLLARSGLRYEAALAATGSSSGAGPESPLPAVTLRGLASLWAATLSAASPDVTHRGRGEIERVLAQVLAEVLSAGGAPDDGLAGIVDRLRAALLRATRSIRSGPAHSALEGAAEELNVAGLAGRREGALLARLFGLDPRVDPRLLAQWSAQAALADLKHDLKALLLRARGAFADGPPGEALGQALAGLEAEQLLNLARRESHDAWHWSFPVPDEGGWRTAHLFHRAGRDRDGSGESAEGGEHAHRFVLGIELSQLGPVRAELLLQNDMLGVRVLVTRSEVAERVRADLIELRDRIATGDRRVHVSVVEGTPAEASVDSLLADIRYLREHPLLDLSG